MSDGGMPTYMDGDTVRVCVEVKSWGAGKGIHRVRATFVHEADPTKKLEFSDDLERRSHAQVQTEEVELKGLVVADAHPAGEYHPEAMAAEYPGGRQVRFTGAPDAALRIVEEEIRSPEISRWRWL